jgi:type IV secretory pathway TraG/TraD family ATPase VirD4
VSADARARPAWELADLALAAMAAALGAGGLLWAGAWTAATVRSLPAPAFDPTRATQLLSHPADPSAAWGTPMPGPVLYWTTTGLLLLLAGAGLIGFSWAWRGRQSGAARDPRDLPGLATRAEVRAAAGSRAVARRARQARPSLTRPSAGDVAYRLGRARGVPAWASVEDSMLLLGPPRSGKGLHVVIPTILDAPGAVVTTSTRPDNLAVTMRAREQLGPVAVFDPQHLAAGLPGGLAWSPVRGCELPQTAMIRARGLAAGVGMTRGVEGGDFWTGQTESVLRGLLHAAAIDGRGAVDLYRWSLDPVSCSDAVTILDRSGVAPGWEEALDQAIHADPRTRDSIWLGVRQALSSLADPRVLDAVTPRPGEAFDPASFLASRGTLYLLGTSSGAGAAAALVAALVEDMVETARRIAARSTGARLDPPLLLALDEIGNLGPLPSLPALMSEGGGSGITTLTVLQSLSQARDRWGEQAANTIWDAAIAKIVLGGGSNARDLADLSALIGERDEDVHSTSRDSRGGRTTSWNTRRIPVMASSRLRTLPFGTGVLLLRSAPPIVLDLQPWTTRRDAAALTAGRERVEARFRRAASTP